MVEDERRDVAGMGVTVTGKAAALGGFVDRGLEDPEVLCRTTEREHRFRGNPDAVLLLGNPKQLGVSDIVAFERAGTLARSLGAAEVSGAHGDSFPWAGTRRLLRLSGHPFSRFWTNP